MTYKFEDNVRYSSLQKNYVDFNNPDRYDSVVWQGTEATVDFIPAVATPPAPEKNPHLLVPVTFQCEVIFPKLRDKDHPFWFPLDFGYAGAPTTELSSIAGMHKVDGFGRTNTVPAEAILIFMPNVLVEMKDAFFILTSNLTGNLPPLLKMFMITLVGILQ